MIAMPTGLNLVLKGTTDYQSKEIDTKSVIKEMHEERKVLNICLKCTLPKCRPADCKRYEAQLKRLKQHESE